MIFDLYIYNNLISIITIVITLSYVFAARDKFKNNKTDRIYLCVIFYHTMFTLFYSAYSSNLILYGTDSYSFYNKATSLYPLYYGNHIMFNIGFFFSSWIKFNYLNLNLFSNFIFILGFTIFFKNIDFRNLKKDVKILLNLILFFPSLHFWNNGFSKELIIFFSVCLALNSIINNKNIFYYLIISIFLTAIIRPHIAFFIYLLFFIQIFFSKNHKLFNSKLIDRVMISIFLYFIFLLSLKFLGISYDQNLLTNIISFIHERQDENITNSFFIVDKETNYLKLFYNFYLYPNFFHGLNSFSSLILVFENTLLIILLILLLKNFSLLSLKDLKIINLLFFILILSYIFALTNSNFGILIRYKSMLWMPIYFLFYLIFKKNLPDVKKKNI